MDRPIGLGRGLTENDQQRRSTVAVVGATLASKLFGGSDPVGRDLVIEGVPFRIVGVLAGGQIFNEEMYMDANGVLIPLDTYMDRMDTDHQLTQIAVKLKSKNDLDEVSATLLARARQAHHGIEDVEVEGPRRRAGARLRQASRTRCTAGPWSSSASPAPCSWWAASASSR